MRIPRKNHRRVSAQTPARETLEYTNEEVRLLIEAYRNLALVAIPCRCDLPLVGRMLYEGNLILCCRRCGAAFQPVCVQSEQRQTPEVWTMEGQPRWRAGEEPARIENVCWGFRDHFGNSFHIPKGMRGRVDVVKHGERWVWLAYP